MKDNAKLLLTLPLSLLLVACSSNVKDERLETFATGLPKGEVKALATEYENKDLQLKNAGLLDSDKDGVIDIRDKCNEYLDNPVVDNKGCAEALSEVKTTDLTIQFDTESAEIKTQYFEEIGKLAVLHQKNSEHKILIEGHTDSTGSRITNMALSKYRAEAVAKVLIEKYSVPVADILVSGFGPDNPIADNTNAEGRKNNRRMVAHVVFEDRIVQHQWNIWSVELGDKQSEVKQFYQMEGIK